MALIELDNVVKYFGANEVVSALDLVVPDGSFTVLLGPSGCGKTTTLQMIAGLELVSGGAIAFDGTDVTRVPPHKRDVAMVFQSYALYPNKTVYDNMAYGLKIRHTPREETARRVNDASPPPCQVASVSGWPSVAPLSVGHEPSC
jgi:ABC-type sugar transport system ATPase subunit